MRWIKRFQNEFKAQIIDLIEPETFHLNLKTETPEETIEYMCDHLKNLGYSDDAFKKSVLQRKKWHPQVLCIHLRYHTH